MNLFVFNQNIIYFYFFLSVEVCVLYNKWLLFFDEALDWYVSKLKKKR